jgi:uncharacterized protein (TIGR03435 family)
MRALSVLLTAAMGVSVAAQQPAPAFDVVSIKRSSPNATGGSVGAPPGRFVMVNMDVRPVIGTAYEGEVDISDYIGLPGWATTERFDIEAKAPEGSKPADIAPMVRALLAERFAFKAHVETRQGPIYELTRVNPGAPLPPGLEKIGVDCDALRSARQRGEKPELKPLSSGLFPCNMSMKGGRGMEIQSGGMTMAGLGRSVQSGTGRIIVDRTGLEGFFAFTLRYSGGNASPDSDPPTLFTALQEQLGLKLQSATGPVRVLVIDHIERPTEN